MRSLEKIPERKSGSERKWYNTAANFVFELES